MGIKDKLIKARSKLSIGTYKRPQVFIISLMLLINIVILVVAAFIALAIDSSYSNFFDAFANGSVKWMLTPNAILLIENPETLLLAVFVLVIGMVLFTGTIIALTTNAIKDYFQKKQSGSGKLILDKQIVVLNWNNKVTDLVADLLYLNDETLALVILADVDKSEVEKIINNTIKGMGCKKSLKNLNILVKKGNPLLKSDLDDISIEKAKSILIMNMDMSSSLESLSQGDLNVIKTILSIGEIKFENTPPIVAEIKNIETKGKVLTMGRVVKSLKQQLIIPVCFDRRLGHVIAQTIINPLIKEVYLSLFSFEGAEIYCIKDHDIESALKELSHIIPVAQDSEYLYVLAENDKQLHLQSSQDINPILLDVNEINYKSEMKVYIIGQNNKLRFIKDSFEEYEEVYQGNFKSQSVDENKLENFVKDFNLDDTPSTILLLSNEFVDRSSLDANVINNLIHLQGNLQGDRNIIVEVLDPANDHIIKDFNINNTIISNKIISLLLSKLALYKETAPFYENLLTIKSENTKKDDQNIVIVEAKTILNNSFPLKFDSIKQMIISFYHSYDQKYMLFGLFKNNQLTIFYGNLEKQEKTSIETTDKLVFMKL